jgi:hypothetical protein
MFLFSHFGASIAVERRPNLTRSLRAIELAQSCVKRRTAQIAPGRAGRAAHEGETSSGADCVRPAHSWQASGKKKPAEASSVGGRRASISDLSFHALPVCRKLGLSHRGMRYPCIKIRYTGPRDELYILGEHRQKARDIRGSRAAALSKISTTAFCSCQYCSIVSSGVWVASFAMVSISRSAAMQARAPCRIASLVSFSVESFAAMIASPVECFVVRAEFVFTHLLGPSLPDPPGRLLLRRQCRAPGAWLHFEVFGNKPRPAYQPRANYAAPLA